MSIAHLLEDFQPLFTASDSPTETISETSIQDAYERGYKAGWDDAFAAAEKEKQDISSELAQNLRDLNFTFAEAKSATASEFDAMIDVLMAEILPDIAKTTLGAQLSQQLRILSKGQQDLTIQLAVADGDAEAVQAILPDVPGVHPDVFVDPQLPTGTVQWRVGSVEQQIDVNRIVKDMDNTVRGFFNELKKEKQYA